MYTVHCTSSLCVPLFPPSSLFPAQPKFRPHKSKGADLNVCSPTWPVQLCWCLAQNQRCFLKQICYFTWQGVLTGHGCPPRTVPHFFLCLAIKFSLQGRIFSPRFATQPANRSSPFNNPIPPPPTPFSPGGIPDYRENGHCTGQLGFSLFRVQYHKIATFLFPPAYLRWDSLMRFFT